MTVAELQSQSTQVTDADGRRPTDDELDLFGITHQGKVRPDNQDHFMLGTIHPQVVVHGTSLPNVDTLPLRGGRFGTLMLVADGVGGAASGSDAARLATEAVTRYVSSTLRCYHTAGDCGDEAFFTALKEAALQAHDMVRAEAASRPEQRRMATTLTLGIGVWPWLYVVQVGDSRCYMYVDGKLQQVTRDQTVGQQLVDDGAMGREQLRHSPLRNVLASAIGAKEATPEVTRVGVRRGCVVLFCSDGLTRHVTDDEIAERFAKMRSSEQVARELLDLALERGGTDNITLIVARAARQKRSDAA
jgi:serine/threonine protein phosphatase PrpC